jgi:hypothetical protein
MIKYSIGITTYDYRFTKYFVNLVESIRLYRPNIDIIVSINGNYGESFNERYRKNILAYCSNVNNVFPIIFPSFRGLSKLWNTCIIHSPTDKMLVLNDDITIENAIFFDSLENYIDNKAFKINNSWSHYFVDRNVVSDIGWFDERFLGLGEEDGDFEFRWGFKYQTHFPSINIPNIINHVDHEDCCKNMHKVFGKYSAFNRKFMFGYKYNIDNENGSLHGITNVPLVCSSPTPPQYTLEPFFWQNNHLLGANTNNDSSH